MQEQKLAALVREIPLPGQNSVYPGRGLHRFAAYFNFNNDSGFSVIVEYTLDINSPDEFLLENSIVARAFTSKDTIYIDGRNEAFPNGSGNNDYDGWPIIEAAINKFTQLARERHYSGT